MTVADSDPDREIVGRCTRCGQPFRAAERRVQPRGGDLCRRCHLDPRARALPVELTNGARWLHRCAGTLWQLLRAPNASFRRVREPVDHARVISFLLTIRLPLWLVLVAALGVRFIVREGPDLLRPGAFGYALDPNLADALSMWLLLLAPIGVPVLYFLGGIVAHGAVVLSGGASRSLGASMRAFGCCAAWPWLVVATLDIPVHFSAIDPDVYAVLLGVVVAWQYVALSLALARTHGMRIFRGFAVAPLAVALFVGVAAGRALLELPRAPFVEPVVAPRLPFLPYRP
ncbi:MAG: YIP1 family protein [Myxococcales bacterium FL481]|nr:MAG: YIP1 family protein [Myxococcales bacterium FL481]